MSVRVDMSSLEHNRERVNTQAIGVKSHQCAYVREMILFGMIIYVHTSIVPCKNTFPAKNIMISKFFVFHFHHYCYTEPLPPVNVTVEQVNNSHINLTWEYSMGIVRPCEVLITPLLTGLESGVS